MSISGWQVTYQLSHCNKLKSLCVRFRVQWSPDVWANAWNSTFKGSHHSQHDPRWKQSGNRSPAVLMTTLVSGRNDLWQVESRGKNPITGINVSSNMNHTTNLQWVWYLEDILIHCFLLTGNKFVATDFRDSKSQRQLKMPFLKIILNCVTLYIRKRWWCQGATVFQQHLHYNIFFSLKQPMEPTI